MEIYLTGTYLDWPRVCLEGASDATFEPADPIDRDRLKVECKSENRAGVIVKLAEGIQVDAQLEVAAMATYGTQ